jgi:hypothetical protein
MNITESERQKMQELISRMRRVAAKVGPMHSFWDVICDMEFVLEGKEDRLQMTPAEWISYAEDCLSGR